MTSQQERYRSVHIVDISNLLSLFKVMVSPYGLSVADCVRVAFLYAMTYSVNSDGSSVFDMRLRYRIVNEMEVLVEKSLIKHPLNNEEEYELHRTNIYLMIQKMSRNLGPQSSGYFGVIDSIEDIMFDFDLTLGTLYVRFKKPAWEAFKENSSISRLQRGNPRSLSQP
ncbi:hypothetical protein CPT_Moabite_032 [Serratia phage Moabite]|uniref:Uncharacterized protein n=3 Tax=Moabitevirus TaxID=2843422 RepID=A0A7T3NBQ8_9CAUD|nr:hypothetical protein HWB23_gp301 [Serratia phage vB_SmaM_ 2050HW]YP_009849128.1 hypothetical protein HWC48_gp032 [Serratia phage Moabite]QPX76786.1 hypothetical protein [Serratia phage vB_SmaM_Yaphecito]UCR74573.1 hypothetical protein [Serratia phage BUCT660]UGO54249.1 hypothetical protein HAYMO_267 [Serratia phage vB_SmaM_Haymo]ATA65636.1 hypothetical protein 2050HW_00301 [Serratia phage vB_SmaM_ 2050HW]QDB71064.1 hypothetical protein CPT_Moabite_032 [Serratia phage Moabite]